MASALPEATFVCYKNNGDSFQFGDDVKAKEFIVKYENQDAFLAKLREVHNKGNVRDFIIEHNNFMLQTQAPVTLRSFTHMKLSRWDEVVSVYAYRGYIPLNKWIPIDEYMEKELDFPYLLKNIAADHIYQGGNLILQFKNELKIKIPPNRLNDCAMTRFK